MQYFVDCECGESIPVAETAAGATALCPCGRSVAIPSLRELRRQAGVPQSRPTPEMEVETLLLAGKLPAEDYCVLCGVATDASICCRTECERAHVEASEPPWWVYAISFLTFGLLGVAIIKSTKGEDQEWGTDRMFPLPLRVCATCQSSLSHAEELKAALCRVPLYRRLLQKYPGARVSLVASE